MTPSPRAHQTPEDTAPRHPAGAGDAPRSAGDPSGPGEAPDAPAELDELADEIDIGEFVDPDVQNRLWLRAVVPLLQLRSQETDPSQRVEFALDRMFIAACERVAASSGPISGRTATDATSGPDIVVGSPVSAIPACEFGNFSQKIPSLRNCNPETGSY